MLGPGDTIDDVLQEVFVQFYKNLTVFRGDSSVKTYLNRIAINRSLDVLRRRRRRFKRFVGLDEAGASEIAAESADPSGPDETVWKAVDRLSDDQKAVVTLRLVDGYSTQETAEILGVRYGTVLSRLSRASENLRTMLQPAAGEDRPK
jgi:RNA polymerase sigma-70 factor (ECF subfamily)